jgi:hypothetical protein
MRTMFCRWPRRNGQSLAVRVCAGKAAQIGALAAARACDEKTHRATAAGRRDARGKQHQRSAGGGQISDFAPCKFV